MKIRCDKCKIQIAVLKGGWLEIKGKTDFRSNNAETFINCPRCTKENVIKF